MNIKLQKLEEESDFIYVRTLIIRSTEQGHFLFNSTKALDAMIGFAAIGAYSLPDEDGLIRYNPNGKLVKAELFLIFANDQRAGFALIVGSNEFEGITNSGTSDFGSRAEILMIVIDQKYKNQGIGKQVVSNLISYLSDKGVTTVRARAKIKSTVMVKILNGIGFTLVNETSAGTKHYELVCATEIAQMAS